MMSELHGDLYGAEILCYEAEWYQLYQEATLLAIYVSNTKTEQDDILKLLLAQYLASTQNAVES